MLPGLPAHAEQYAALFEQVASDAVVPPYLLAAICARESDFGRALTPTGPSGTGDHQPRTRPVSVTVPVRIVSTEPLLVMPADGLGWGRGLMQLDWEWHPEFWRSDRWQDPAANIQTGASVLAQLLDAFDGDEFLALAGYNAGEGKIMRAWHSAQHLERVQLEHIIDSYTTGRDYAADCLRRRDQFIAADKAAQPVTLE